jgi:glyoxalase family protein
MSATKNHKKGIHHITILSGDAQTNYDFYVKKLGLRMVLKSVNQDDPGVYHLFYANGAGKPGSSITFFPWPMAHQGIPGTGEAVAVSFAVPAGSVSYWKKRLHDQGIEFEGPVKRFGLELIRFRDPDKMMLELVFDPAADAVDAWKDATVPEEHGIRGFWGTTMRIVEIDGTISLLTDVFGFSKKAEEGDLTLLQSDSEIGHSVIIEKAPQHVHGRNGRGIIHHVAFRTEDEAEELELRSKVIEHGLQPTNIIDRHVFKSVYFRSPGGVLFEIATDGPGYRSVAERDEDMGRDLFLPEWLEPRRDYIESILPEIKV